MSTAAAASGLKMLQDARRHSPRAQNHSGPPVGKLKVRTLKGPQLPHLGAFGLDGPVSTEGAASGLKMLQDARRRSSRASSRILPNHSARPVGKPKVWTLGSFRLDGPMRTGKGYYVRGRPFIAPT